MDEINNIVTKNACLAKTKGLLFHQFSEALKTITIPPQPSENTRNNTCTSRNSNYHLKLLVLSSLDMLASRCRGGCNSAESILRNLIQEEKLIEILISCLGDNDAFVAYSACKATATLLCSLKSLDFYELADSLITDSFNKFKSIEMYESCKSEMQKKTVYPWEVVTTVLNRMCTQENKAKSCCMNDGNQPGPENGFITYCCKMVLELLKNPEEYNTICYMIEDSSKQEDENENCLMSILLLIEASLKYAIKNLTEDLVSILKSCESFFVCIADSLNRCINPLVYKRILDMLNFYLFNMNENEKLKCTVMLSTKLLSMTMGDLFENAPYKNVYMAFGGSVFSDYSNLEDEYQKGDMEMLRKLSVLVVKNCEVIYMTSSLTNLYPDVTKSFNKLSRFVNSKLCFKSNTICDWLFHLYADNDTSLICIMFLLLRIHNQSLSTDIKSDPHQVFQRFLKTVAYDHSVLLDLLISDETEFLAYFVQYLHTVVSRWSAFKELHSNLDLPSTYNEVCKTKPEDIDSVNNRTVMNNSEPDNYWQQGENEPIGIISKPEKNRNIDTDLECLNKEHDKFDSTPYRIAEKDTGLIKESFEGGPNHSKIEALKRDHDDNNVMDELGGMGKKARYSVNHQGSGLPLGDASTVSSNVHYSNSEPSNQCTGDLESVNQCIGDSEPAKQCTGDVESVNQCTVDLESVNQCTGDIEFVNYCTGDVESVNQCTVDLESVNQCTGDLGYVNQCTGDLESGNQCTGGILKSTPLVLTSSNDVDIATNVDIIDNNLNDHNDSSDNNSFDNDSDDDDSSLDKTMTTLIRLRLSIERMVNRRLFPFHVNSLLKLLENVEGLYENQ